MIVDQVNKTEKDGKGRSFDGVIIDFEGFKGTDLKAGFNSFLEKLKK